MSQERITRIVARVTALERSEAEQEARIMLDRFMERHVKLECFLLRRFEEVRDHVITDRPLNDWQKLLVGAYFTLEYSLEAAALFNPSMGMPGCLCCASEIRRNSALFQALAMRTRALLAVPLQEVAIPARAMN